MKKVCMSSSFTIPYYISFLYTNNFTKNIEPLIDNLKFIAQNRIKNAKPQHDIIIIRRQN